MTGVDTEKSKRVSINFRQYAMILALIVLFILFTSLTKGSFIQTRNLSNLARQMAITGVLATGMSMVIISGNIDLSVGTLLGFIGGIGAAGMVVVGLGHVHNHSHSAGTRSDSWSGPRIHRCLSSHASLHYDSGCTTDFQGRNPRCHKGHNCCSTP